MNLKPQTPNPKPQTPTPNPKPQIPHLQVKVAMKTVTWTRRRGQLLLDDGMSADQLGTEAGAAKARSAIGGGGEESSSDDWEDCDRDETGENGGMGGGVHSVPPGERRAALALNALYQFRLTAHADREVRPRPAFL